MLVIFDTNVLIAFAITNRPPIQHLKDAWLTGEIDVAISNVLIEEYTRVTAYKHLSKYFVGTERQARINDLIDLGIPVNITEPYPNAPDPDDNYLFAMLEHPQVIALVSGDKALLNITSFNSKPILSPAAFVEQYLAHYSSKTE